MVDFFPLQKAKVTSYISRTINCGNSHSVLDLRSNNNPLHELRTISLVFAVRIEISWRLDVDAE